MLKVAKMQQWLNQTTRFQPKAATTSKHGRGTTLRHRFAPAVTAILAATGVLLPAGQASAVVTQSPVVYNDASYHFSYPQFETISAGKLWVTNADNSVVEINPIDGSLEKRFTDPALGLNQPGAIGVSGDTVMVANTGDNSVTMFSASSGSLLSKLSNTSYGFDQPSDIAVSANVAFVANAGVSNTVTMFNATSGALLAVLSDSSYGFNQPQALAISGNTLYVANAGSSTVTKVNATSGAVIGVLSSASYHFDGPGAFAVGSGVLYVLNDGSITEISTSTDAVVQVISLSSDGVNFPTAISLSGGRLFLPYGTLNSVTVLNATTGALISTLSGTSYGFNSPFGAVSDGNQIWVTNVDGNALTEFPVNASATLTSPGAPTGLTASVLSGTSLSFSWSAPATNGGAAISSYTVRLTSGVTCTTTSNTAAQSKHSCSISALTTGTAYTASVTARTVFGPSAASPTTSATPASVPNAPTGVSATPSDGGATIAWLAPSANGSAITAYEVSDGFGHGCSASAPTRSCLISGLVNASTYLFSVTAMNAIGSSVASASVAVVPAGVPDAPTEVTVSAGDGTVLVAWVLPADHGSALVSFTATVVGKTNLKCTALVASASPNSCVITGLTNGTSNQVTVTASNGIGQGAASAASATFSTLGVPSAPLTLEVQPGINSATVTWNTPASNGGAPITKYLVTSGGGLLCTVMVGEPLSCIISGLLEGVSYPVSVVAVNQAGSSIAALVSFQLATVPGTPTSVRAVSGDNSAVISWVGPTNDGGAPILGYDVSDGFGHSCSTNSNAVLTCTVSGLTNGDATTLTVRARNAIGESAPGSVIVTPAAAPRAPTSVVGTPALGSLIVTWNTSQSNGSPVTGYIATAQPGGRVCTTAEVVCTITGLTRGTNYTVTVRGTNALGTSLASIASQAATPLSLPGVPTAISVVLGRDAVTLSWSSPTDAGGLDITSYRASVGSQNCSPDAVAVRSCTISGLTPGTRYSALVTATTDLGTGAAASKAFTSLTLPGAVSGLVAAGGFNSMVLSWSAPASLGGGTLLGYIVQDGNGHGCGLVSPPTTSCTVSGLTNGDRYTFSVVATTVEGSGPSTAVTSRAGVLPSPPSAVTAVANARAIVVSWTPGGSGSMPILSYTVTAQPGGQTWTTTAPSYTVTSLVGKISYRFSVTQTTIVGTSLASSTSAAVVMPSSRLELTISHFPSGQAALSALMKGNLKILAQSIVQKGDRKISIVGYACNESAPGASYQVSLSRANVVAAALAAEFKVLHFTGYTITTRGAGSVNFIAPITTGAGRSLNRRVLVTAA